MLAEGMPNSYFGGDLKWIIGLNELIWKNRSLKWRLQIDYILLMLEIQNQYASSATENWSIIKKKTIGVAARWSMRSPRAGSPQCLNKGVF